MPRTLTAYGGVDTLTHALESYMSIFATDFTKARAALCMGPACCCFSWLVQCCVVEAFAASRHFSRVRTALTNAACPSTPPATPAGPVPRGGAPHPGVPAPGARWLSGWAGQSFRACPGHCLLACCGSPGAATHETDVPPCALTWRRPTPTAAATWRRASACTTPPPWLGWPLPTRCWASATPWLTR